MFKTSLFALLCSLYVSACSQPADFEGYPVSGPVATEQNIGDIS